MNYQQNISGMAPENDRIESAYRLLVKLLSAGAFALGTFTLLLSVVGLVSRLMGWGNNPGDSQLLATAATHFLGGLVLAAVLLFVGVLFRFVSQSMSAPRKSGDLRVLKRWRHRSASRAEQNLDKR